MALNYENIINHPLIGTNALLLIVSTKLTACWWDNFHYRDSRSVTAACNIDAVSRVPGCFCIKPYWITTYLSAGPGNGEEESALARDYVLSGNLPVHPCLQDFTSSRLGLTWPTDRLLHAATFLNWLCRNLVAASQQETKYGMIVTDVILRRGIVALSSPRSQGVNLGPISQRPGSQKDSIMEYCGRDCHWGGVLHPLCQQAIEKYDEIDFPKCTGISEFLWFAQ